MVAIMDGIGGGKHEGYESGCSEVIKSKDIISFFYNCGEYSLSAKIEDNKLKINATGGSSLHRDGTYFIINYLSDDFSLLSDLQKIIEKYDLVKNNGHCVHVDGLPAGIGDTLRVEYKSGEKIYRSSNQFHTIIDDASSAIYEAFHKYVLKYGLDFNSKGSNVKLYDDADQDYVQGTWKGKHFGSEIVATFDKDNVVISVDGVETDNCKYTIFEGHIITDKLKENKEATNYTDYEFFKGVSTMSKKNYFTMSAYFMGDSYSSCDLMNFDKEKPKKEK